MSTSSGCSGSWTGACWVVVIVIALGQAAQHESFDTSRSKGLGGELEALGDRQVGRRAAGEFVDCHPVRDCEDGALDHVGRARSQNACSEQAAAIGPATSS